MPKVVAETPIDSEVIVKVWRNGEIIDIKVKVGELEEGRKLAENDGVYLEELDITVLELTIDAINSLGLDSKTKGILVTEVGDNNENLCLVCFFKKADRIAITKSSLLTLIFHIPNTLIASLKKSLLVRELFLYQ